MTCDVPIILFIVVSYHLFNVADVWLVSFAPAITPPLESQYILIFFSTLILLYSVSFNRIGEREGG